mmetsp:Transcript_26714/g.57913  ORF Transcript_26714/g.57913 Transcript_26714/m.57913 type:complete len:135 (-) Transcript_26714:36-440(-)
MVNDSWWQPWLLAYAAHCTLNDDKTKSRARHSAYHVDAHLRLSMAMQRYCYFGGKILVAKRWVYQRFPLTPSLNWGFGEDVIWSFHLSQHVVFHQNPWSTVRVLTFRDIYPNISQAFDYPELLKQGLVYVAGMV